MSTKTELINDIQDLLNTYEGVRKTHISTDMLDFMDRETLLSIINSLLDQKEAAKESDLEWLKQFKT